MDSMAKKRETLGRVIHDQRQKKGMTIPELVQKSGVSEKFIECIEKGTIGERFFLNQLGHIADTIPMPPRARNRVYGLARTIARNLRKQNSQSHKREPHRPQVSRRQNKRICYALTQAYR